jgi:hypothetical protein
MQPPEVLRNPELCSANKVDLLQGRPYAALNMVTWILQFDSGFEDWLCQLSADAQELAVAAIELLEEFGPTGELARVTIAPRGDEGRTFVLPSGHVTLRYRVDAAGGVIVLTDGYVVEATDVGRLQFLRALEATGTEPRRMGNSRVQ